MVFDIERGVSSKIEPLPWQSETCIGDWHYSRDLYNHHWYKNANYVIRSLADVVSKNGVFLLNIPVRADGTIDDQEVAIVKDIGVWMKTNGEAIYATRPWKVCGEGPGIDKAPPKGAPGSAEDKTAPKPDEIRFTTKGDTLYAIVYGWPTKPVTIKSLGANAGLLDGTITNVTLLGTGDKVAWTQSDAAVTIQPPAKPLFTEAAVYKFTVKK